MATQSIAGYNGVVYVSTDGGTTYNAVGELQDCTLKRTTKMFDATSHASAGDEESVPGNRSWTATATLLSVYSDAGQAAILAALTPGTKLKFRFDPAGTASGKVRREGFGYIQDIQEKMPTTNLVTEDITITGTGPLTLSTQ